MPKLNKVVIEILAPEKLTQGKAWELSKKQFKKIMGQGGLQVVRMEIANPQENKSEPAN